MSCVPKALPQMASRVYNASRVIKTQTDYGRRMARLSNRIFTEPIHTVDKKSAVVMRVMSEEPCEQREDKSVEYYPNLPMFHYLTKLLRLHGLFMDDHTMFRLVQDDLKILRGKVVRPPIGQGKRAQIRSANK